MFDVQLNGTELKVQVNTRRLDATNVEGLRARIEEYVTDLVDSIQIDMSGVEFIDSSGIGVLLSLQRCLKDNSGAVTLVGVEGAVLSIIELLHLNKAFKFEKADSA